MPIFVTLTESDVNLWVGKTWTAIDRLTSILESDLSEFLQAVVRSVLLYGCAALTLTKRLETNLDGNYTTIMSAALDKFRLQQATKQHLYGHPSPISPSIQARHFGHFWRSKDEFISDFFPKDFYGWTHQYCPINKRLRLSGLCGHWVPSKGLRSSRWWKHFQ